MSTGCGWLPPLIIICFQLWCTQVRCATRFQMSSLSSFFEIQNAQKAFSLHTLPLTVSLTLTLTLTLTLILTLPLPLPFNFYLLPFTC